MGLLDFMGSGDLEDPKTQATMALAQGLLSTRGMRGLAQGLAGYSQSMSQAKQQALAEQMRKMQLEQHALMLQEAKRKAEQDERDRGAFREPGMDPQAMLRGGVSPQAVATYMQLMTKDQPKLETLAPGAKAGFFKGGQWVDVASNPVKEKEAAPTEVSKLIAEMDRLPQGHPFRKVYEDAIRKATTHAPSMQVSYGAPMAGVDKNGNPVFFQPSKDGSAPSIVQGVAPPKTEKPLTEAQAKAAAFASQMLSAEQALASSGISGGSLAGQVQTKIAQGMGNFVAPPEAQKARQAQEQWSEAFLRFKTGAAATEAEVARNVRTYFPQPGDSAAVVKQKEEMRRQAAHDVQLNAGGARIESVIPPPASQAGALTPAEQEELARLRKLLGR